MQQSKATQQDDSAQTHMSLAAFVKKKSKKRKTEGAHKGAPNA
jgi:hypothetical protein